MTDRNCMTFNPSPEVDETLKKSLNDSHDRLFGSSVSHLVTADTPLHDPQDVIDAVNILVDWCFDNMRKPVFFTLEVDKMNYVTGVRVRAEVAAQNASISHEDDLRGSEIEKTGGSEGGNVSEAPGGNSDFEHLLERYMRHVDRMEGTTFVEALSRMDNDWTCEEWKILSEIRERIVESSRI